MSFVDTAADVADVPPSVDQVAEDDVGVDRTAADRRRFTRASLWGIGLAAIPYLWVLWGGALDPLRTALPKRAFSDFYETQARALFDGTWAVPKHSLGIEAFVIDGHHYLYFGPFASVLRMPILAVTDALDGKLTAPSMLLAWLVTAFFLPILVWRVRILMRGDAAVTRGEAISVGAFIGAVLGGSVIVYLAALPWIYHEDFAWSIALVVGALCTLLGVLERPTTRRVVLLGVLVLCAVLNRSATGWACVIAVLLAAAYVGTGRIGDEHRRWWRWLLAAALIPLVVNCAVTWAKFGTPFGLPMASQVWTKLDQHRRDFLDANGGLYFSPTFLPSTLLAYFRPDGLRLTQIFPFITLPANPAHAVNGVILDQTYRTGSLPWSTPLPFLLACWGLVCAFRPRPVGRTALLRIPLLGAAAATVGVLVWGYIAHRYLADLMPIVIIAGAVGLVDLWRRLDGKGRGLRRLVVAASLVLALLGVLINVAISVPTEKLAWGGDKARDYVETQESVGELTGWSLQRNVVFGNDLPAQGPADQIYVLGVCDGLYVSTGEFDRPWVPLELRTVDFDFTINAPLRDLPRDASAHRGHGPAVQRGVDRGFARRPGAVPHHRRARGDGREVAGPGAWASLPGRGRGRHRAPRGEHAARRPRGAQGLDHGPGAHEGRERTRGRARPAAPAGHRVQRAPERRADVREVRDRGAPHTRDRADSGRFELEEELIAEQRGPERDAEVIDARDHVLGS